MSQFLRTRPADSRSELPFRQPPHFIRTAAYIVIALVLGAFFIASADRYARDIEYLRDIGIAVEGTVTQATKTINGGRQPGYWLYGTFPAVSPSGRALDASFSFNVTEAEFNTARAGDTLALIYDPDRVSQPVRAHTLAQLDTAAVRLGAVAGAAFYIVIGIALSFTDWRLRLQRSRRNLRLRSAFGTR